METPVTVMSIQILHLQGSDIETVTSENGSTNDNPEFVSEEYVSLQEEEQAIDLQGKILKEEQFHEIGQYLL